VRSHPRYTELEALISAILPSAEPFVGVGYRYARPKYAHPERLLSGSGALAFGGRYNPAGAFSAVYLSLTPEAAQAELTFAARASGFPLKNRLPVVLCSVAISVVDVVDLTSIAVRRALRVSVGQLREEWETLQAAGDEGLTQALGRAARSAGAEALLYPSARFAKGTNLVLFPDRLRPTSVCEADPPYEVSC
jgi:RES domain-containing protein